MPYALARGLLAATHPGPTLAVCAYTAAVARASGAPVARVVATVALGQASVGWSNDALDGARDSHTLRTSKPVVRGDVTRIQLAVAAAAAAAGSLATGGGLPAAAGRAHAVALASAAAYNLGLKATPASPLPYALSFGLVPPVLVARASPGSPPAPSWLVGAAALVGASAHFTNAVADLERDLTTGVRGLPQRLGLRRSAQTAAGLAAAGALLVISGQRDPAALACAGGSLALSALGAERARRGRDRGLFALSLAGIAPLVAVVVRRGGAVGRPR